MANIEIGMSVIKSMAHEIAQKVLEEINKEKYEIKDRIESYNDGYTSGARDFAEWLCRKSDYTDIDINGFMTCRCGDSPRDTTIEQVLAEWEEGEENE